MIIHNSIFYPLESFLVKIKTLTFWTHDYEYSVAKWSNWLANTLTVNSKTILLWKVRNRFQNIGMYCLACSSQWEQVFFISLWLKFEFAPHLIDARPHIPPTQFHPLSLLRLDVNEFDFVFLQGVERFLVDNFWITRIASQPCHVQFESLTVFALRQSYFTS